VRAAAQRRIAREYSAEAFRSRLRELLDGRLPFQRPDGSRGPEHGGRNPPDRRERRDVLSVERTRR
jgi:hypothetical protein